MAQHLTDSRRANLVAHAICAAYGAYQVQFEALTGRAMVRFEQREWPEMQSDAAERLNLYKQVVDRTVAQVRQMLADRVDERLVWASMKAVYSGLIAGRHDWEIAETFFNSITRRIFATVGVDAQIEFVDTDFDTPPTPAEAPVYRRYPWSVSLIGLIETILSAYPFAAGYAHIQRDARLAAAEITAHLQALGDSAPVEWIDMCRSVFYRNKGGYLVGRIVAGTRIVPLVLALLNTPQGVVIDAVLLTEPEVSILFSFTRSYFHVAVERPYDLVRFLRSIMPRKRVAELYIAIGYHKHGKTELYRDLLRHLATSTSQFEIAPGQHGMVMLVFTMSDYDLVFKVIKDRFDAPKDTTRQAVMEKYDLVFTHDRAGRLVDAQEFEHLQFDRRRFSAPLLDELQRLAAQTVIVEQARVIVTHAYLERRVTPLNLYVREADTAAAQAAVVDYGYAIKDLARTNIFPGDILLKNFGVTRHSRVVFYDYDELCLLTDCSFRSMPQPTSHEEEFAAEPWFSVGEYDIFPAELQRFLGLSGSLREVFERHHADIFSVAFWQQTQARLRAGEVLDIIPYDQRRRLARLVSTVEGAADQPGYG
jgi:isocitrate dehydrogenase kinase/phosphatase